MGRPGDSQDDWISFAEELAENGYQALTYERRVSFGEVWQDVLGAADYLRDNGAQTVLAAGASIGPGPLDAAEQPRSDLNGVIWLAGVLQNRGFHFQATDVSKIACPTLAISGDKDIYCAAGAARKLFAEFDVITPTRRWSSCWLPRPTRFPRSRCIRRI
jgi:dienelactone hydrolase